MFEREGIEVAVQDPSLLPLFQSKAGMYDYLSQKGFAVPRYARFRTKEEFLSALERFGYPLSPLLVKPDVARGGRGVTLLNETFFPNPDGLPLLDKRLFLGCVDGTTGFLLMDYLEGSVYDVDILCRADGNPFFGIRKRFNNATKQFDGNLFEKNGAILDFAKKLFAVFPTRYLLDYDILLDKKGQPHLLEINPRPSGSTISYLPFGINLYYILAKSYLDGVHLDIPHEELAGRSAFVFHKMIRGHC